jgi:tetratricopeptide (TPR) repeat protein
MKYLVFRNDSFLKGRMSLALAIVLGLPFTVGLLLITQPGMQMWIEQQRQALFDPLEAPYRYPFADSLVLNNRPIARVEAEIAFYQNQLRQQPQNSLDRAALATAYLRMARVTGQGNWYLLAEETAQQSLAGLAVDNSEAIAVLARVAEARHDFTEALRLAEQMPNREEAIGIQTTSYLAMGQLQQAQQAVNELVDQTLSMNAFTLKALVQTAQGQDQQALASFRQALTVEEPSDLSNSARTRVLLGRFYYERGQLQQAEQLYQEALHILPGYPLALLNLAQLEIRQGQYQAANRRYDDITTLADGNTTLFDPLILRGQARLRSLEGNQSIAQALWARAETQLRQSFIGATTTAFGHRRDLARLLLERGRNQDISEAVSLMEAEVKVRRDAETLDTYAWALSQAGRWQDAQRVIRTAIASGIRNAAIFDRASTIEQALGNPTQAQQYAQQARAIDPMFGDRARQAWGLGIGLGS